MLPTVARPGQPTPSPTLPLQPVPAAIAPTQFYVASVRDERAERGAVAYLLTRPAKPALTSTAVQLLDLPGGAAVALRQFMAQSVPRNAALRPVTIRVRECRLQEAAGPAGWANGQLGLSVSFDWQRNGRTIHLTDYRGAARYTRPLSSAYASAEPVLRQALVEALKYFNTWINREAAINPRLATALRVHAADFAPARPDADTLYYSAARPLSFDDFLGAPRPGGGFAASVFPSFAYTAQPRLLNGVLHLHLQTKVFVVRHSSWVLPSARDAYTLNHEQRHFDLVQLVAERFKRKVTPDSMSLDNYDARMQYQFLDSWREMNRLQDQYDAETRHGQDAAAQQRWNERVEAELRRYGVKRPG